MPGYSLRIRCLILGRVHDGDTLTVLVDHTPVRVRLTYIDTPELGSPIFAPAKSRRSMIEEKTATAAPLGRVTCMSIDANAGQVRPGMARVYVRYAPKESLLH